MGDRLIAVEMDQSDWRFVINSLRYTEHVALSADTRDRAGFMADSIEDVVSVTKLCSICHENEVIWLDTVKGEILADGTVSDGSGEYMPVCIDCYDEGSEDTLSILRDWSLGESKVGSR